MNTPIQQLELTEGALYNVTFGEGAPNFTRNGERTPLRFNKSFPCYDGRFHGACSDVGRYVCYEFQLPEKLGVWTAYRFQILNVTPA